MNVDWTTLIGIIAALCTTSSFLPQVVKTLRSKRTKDISLSMYAILATGLFLWLLYGLILRDVPLILANGVSFGFAMCVVLLKLRHG